MKLNFWQILGAVLIVAGLIWYVFKYQRKTDLPPANPESPSPQVDLLREPQPTTTTSPAMM